MRLNTLTLNQARLLAEGLKHLKQCFACRLTAEDHADIEKLLKPMNPRTHRNGVRVHAVRKGCVTT